MVFKGSGGGGTWTKVRIWGGEMGKLNESPKFKCQTAVFKIQLLHQLRKTGEYYTGWVK